MTNDDEAPKSRTAPVRSGLQAGIGLAALAALALIWNAFTGGRTVKIGENGRVELHFRGCDEARRCGTFVIFAPGFNHRWHYGKDTLQQLEQGAPRLRGALAPKLEGARMVIAPGLASNEGDEPFNRRLAACRSKRLASLIDDAQFDLRTAVPTYRITLGRYAPDPTVLTGDAAIERLLVFGFLRDADRDIDLDEALRNGLVAALPTALGKAEGPIARQLDFTRYSCWRSEFSVTPAAQPREQCFAEPSAEAAAFCDDF